MDRGSITWWGIAGIEIHLEGLDFGFDPYLYPDEPRLQYIFITHEHYDHFYEPTLRRLATSPNAKMLVVPKSCFFASRLNSSISEEPPPSDLAWADGSRTMIFYPQITPGAIQYSGPSEARLGRLHVLGVASGENPEQWADLTPLPEPFPTVGYVVTDRKTGLSFYHPGDITDVFDELEQLQGKVTYMFLPIGKLDGMEGRMIHLVQPKYVIPIHYRLATPDWPVPLTVHEEEIVHASWISGHPLPGVAWDDYVRDRSKLIVGHWYPTPRDPEAFLRSLKQEIGDISSIVMLHAGRTYALDRTGEIEGARLIE
jgi:hypothetical protein